MHTYQAHGATDVTGFGILGHASNLAQAQENDVHFLIDKLPIIKHMDKVADVFKFFHLKEGYSAETSGGLLVLLPEENAQVCLALSLVFAVLFHVRKYIFQVFDSLWTLLDCHCCRVSANCEMFSGFSISRTDTTKTSCHPQETARVRSVMYVQTCCIFPVKCDSPKNVSHTIPQSSSEMQHLDEIFLG